MALTVLNVRCVVLMRAVNCAHIFGADDRCPNNAKHSYSSQG